MSDAPAPSAGWYPDPEDPAGERWWNGSGWSDHKRPATPAPAAGFSFGVPAGDEPRPDPYAPAPPASAATPYAPTTYAPATYASTPYAPTPYGAPRAGTTNGLAIAGLVVSAAGWLVLGVLASIAGIILSGFGLARAKQAEAAGNPHSGRGMAMAGLVIGIVVTVIGLIVIGLYAVLIATSFGSSF